MTCTPPAFHSFGAGSRGTRQFSLGVVSGGLGSIRCAKFGDLLRVHVTKSVGKPMPEISLSGLMGGGWNGLGRQRAVPAPFPDSVVVGQGWWLPSGLQVVMRVKLDDVPGVNRGRPREWETDMRRCSVHWGRSIDLAAH